MDLSHPIRSVVPSLDGPVLEVLAGTTAPLSTLEVHRLARVGSPSGVRIVLERLAAQGIVLEDRRGNAHYYRANREHLAWPAIELLAGLRRSMLACMRETLDSWSIRPLHASLFGSAARADGGSEGDIDVLLVRPPLAEQDFERWEDQVDGLAGDVRAMTGNHCQAFVVDEARLQDHAEARDPLVASWLRDELLLLGHPLAEFLSPKAIARVS